MPLAEDQYVLVALAGSGDHPQRVKGQGPFPGAQAATAVARRIAAALEEDGFVGESADSIWQLDAWRHRRQVMDVRSRFHLRTDFHPDDVLS